MAGSISYQDKPWLKSYEKGVPESIKFEEICLPDILERTAKTYADRTALIFQGFKVNYTQLKDMVDRFAACLSRFGVKKGDAVAILLPIDRILDTVRTAVNVEGDMVGSLIVQRLAAVPAGPETAPGS